MTAKTIFSQSASGDNDRPLSLYDFEQAYQQLCTTALDRGFSDLVVTELLYPYYDFKVKLKIDWTSQNTVRSLKDVPFSNAAGVLQEPLKKILGQVSGDIPAKLRAELEGFLPVRTAKGRQPELIAA